MLITKTCKGRPKNGQLRAVYKKRYRDRQPSYRVCIVHLLHKHVLCQHEGSTILHTRFWALCEADQNRKLYRQSIKTDCFSFTKPVFFSAAISKQHNCSALSMCVVSMSLSYSHGKRPCHPCLLVNIRFYVCTSLIPRPGSLVWEQDCMCICAYKIR